MVGNDEIARFAKDGWLRVAGAVPGRLCANVVDALVKELGLPLADPTQWGRYGGPMADLLPMWGHQSQWDIRQYPPLHRIFSALYGTDELWVTLDSCRFTPPWRPGHAEPFAIHWDQPPRGERHFIQGVLALADTAADQGGFRCVPSLFNARAEWPLAPSIDADGDENWLADTATREIVHVPARAGDLIVWHSRLPHGNSANRAAKPRSAFYVSMFPATDDSIQQANVESWRTGRCVPRWRSRRGYDRVEPWPPATLSPLGRKLLGLDSW